MADSAPVEDSTALAEGGLGVWVSEDVRPEVDRCLRRAVAEDVAGRLWRRDDTLWGPPGAVEVADRLGWLDAPRTAAERVEQLEAFVRECRVDGLEEVVLLGMGGSSLAPEVVRRSLAAAGGPPDPPLRLRVLDSVDPEAIADTERSVEVERTLFLASTKSGGTVETLSLARHFLARVEERVGHAESGRHFAAITDPGSPLLELSRERRFRDLFLGDPEIGGRYSALSVFGLVPAALAGADLRALLAGAAEGARLCAPERPGADNLGLQLGTIIGALARAGRDKLSLLIDEPLASLGLWLEQLVAESTGKDGRGIVPVVDEPPAAIERAGRDRLFLALGEPGGEALTRACELGAAGHAAVGLPAGGPADLGRLFFLGEVATAVACWVLGVNAFNQPDVQEAKTRTSAVLERSDPSGDFVAGGAQAGGAQGGETDAAAARDLLDGLRAPEYAAVLAYVPPSEAFDVAAARLRAAIARGTDAAVTFGYGPRYLHSTGQLHKGGPPTGRFLELVREPGEADLPIPEAGYGFRTLLAAQARGDLDALHAAGRPAERVVLRGDPVRAVERLADELC